MVTALRIKLSWPRIRRWSARLLLAMVTLLLLLTASFLTRPSRNLWLGAATRVAARQLPGDLQGQWDWPSLGRLEARDLVWTVPDSLGAGLDTLAALKSLAVEVDLPALRRHDLRLLELSAEAQLVDVPLIMATLPVVAGSDTTLTTADSNSTSAVAFLRPGSLPGLPSVSLDALAASIERLRLPDGLDAGGLAVTGRATMAAGAEPSLTVTRLEGRAAGRNEPRWSANLQSLILGAGYDPASGIATLDSLKASLSAIDVNADTLSIQAGPVNLAVAGNWQPERWQAQVALDFAAGVPRSFQHPLPGMDLERAGGTLNLQAAGEPDSVSLTVDLNLDPTAQLGAALVRGSLAAGLRPEPKLSRARLDTINLRWLDSFVTGSGSWNDQSLKSRLHAELPSLELVHLLVPGLLPGVTGQVTLDAATAGTPADPRFEGTATVRGQALSIWDLPQVAAAADTVLPVDFPRAEFAPVVVNLQARVKGSLEEMAVAARLDLAGTPWLEKGLAAGQAVIHPRSRSLGQARLDTLAVALRQVEISASGVADTSSADLTAHLLVTGPALLDLLAPEALPGAELALEAELSASGPWQHLQGSGSLDGRLASGAVTVPRVHAWFTGSEDSLRAVVQAGGGLLLSGSLVDSLAFDWSGKPDSTATLPPGRFQLRAWAPQGTAWLKGTARGDTVRTARLDTLVVTAAGQTITLAEPVTLAQGPGPRDLALDRLRLHGDLGTLDLAGSFTAESWQASASADLLMTREWLETLFPSPVWSAGGGVDLSLEGNADLTSADETGEPSFSGRSTLQLIPHNEEPPARLEFGFRVAHGDTAALLAEVALNVGEVKLVGGSILAPGRIDPVTGRWLPDPGATGGLEIPEQDLPLGYINRFLPREVFLEGGISVGAGLTMARHDSTGQAMVTDSDVQGQVHTSYLKVNLPNRSRVEFEGKIDLTGRLIDPRLDGKITVNSGLFRIPEVQRSLHPATGTSALWSAVQEAADQADSTLMESWLAEGPLVSPPPPYIPDLDLEISIPGSFFITGYGLDTELAGEIRVRRGQDEKGRPAPTLTGQVRVVEGSLHAMNHIFELEHGEFDLRGRVPANPDLDLVLVTELEDTIIRIKVTGTALQPKVELQSEPEMVQADIMAILLFGRPVNDLDNEQRGNLDDQPSAAQQLRQNLQGLVLVFGTAGLQNRVSEKIGVDQVQLGSDTSGGSALVLGKFINPRLLLKYNASLEKSGTYFMTMEYTLSRLFKLISTYGQGEEASGLELRLQRRY
jgi:hypothetical protein